jgi:RNA polymerase sigma-70 factor (ECF subfamily)
LRPADIDDVIQEVLIAVMEEIPKFKHNGRKGAFRAWLRRIMINRIKEQRRKSGRIRPGDEFGWQEHEDDKSRAGEAWDREHERFVVEKLMHMIEGDFKQTTRDAFRAVFFQGRKAADVAKELGISTSAVRIAKSRVLGRLREVAKDRSVLELLHLSPAR